MPETRRAQYDVLKVSNPDMLKLSEINYNSWLEQDEPVRPCWKKLSLKGKQESAVNVFFSLTSGPEYIHVSQITNAVVVARQLGATLALQNIIGDKLGGKRNLGEIYYVKNFMTSPDGVVRVEKESIADLSNGRLPIVRVPNRVSEDYISSRIKPIFHSKSNLKIVTYFNSSAKIKGQDNRQSYAYKFLAMFESLNANTKIYTKIYLTRTRWHSSLNALRSIFPNSCTELTEPL